MALIDVVEMYIDWQASIKKHKDGDIHNSIKTNHERFGLSDDLVKILTNTANETSDWLLGEDHVYYFYVDIQKENIGV